MKKENTKETNKENTKKNQNSTEIKKSVLRENVEAIVIALILALFIRTFIVQAFKIPSGSMLQTLQIGDHILVNKFIYGVKVPFARKTLIPVTQPKKEDIIVFIYPEDPGKDFIKRVIGVAGDEIRIKDKKVFVNGKHLTGDYEIHVDTNIYPGKFNARDNYGPVRVPEGNVFVMGDNRDNSHDSRFWGFVPLKSVKGKAFIIYWSWKSEDNKGALGWLMFWKWVRWERIGDLLR